MSLMWLDEKLHQINKELQKIQARCNVNYKTEPRQGKLKNTSWRCIKLNPFKWQSKIDYGKGAAVWFIRKSIITCN